MREKSLVVLMIIALLLTACAAQTATSPSVVTQAPFTPASSTAAPTQPLPPAVDTPAPTKSISPTPTTPLAGMPVIPPSGFEPQLGDAKLKRDQIFLDMASSQLVVIFGTPVQAQARLIGTLPDACHALRVVVTPTNTSNTLNLEVYSVVETGKMCIMVISPFTATITLGSFISGDYTVMVNGELLGKFSTAFSPQPGDEKLTRGDVDLDTINSKLITLSDLTGEKAVFLQGNLSNPCHQLRVVLDPSDAQNKVNLAVYSVYDPKSMCAMVIVPFQMIVPLGQNLTGHYTVYVNGQLLGEFDQ